MDKLDRMGIRLYLAFMTMLTDETAARGVLSDVLDMKIDREHRLEVHYPYIDFYRIRPGRLA